MERKIMKFNFLILIFSLSLISALSLVSATTNVFVNPSNSIVEPGEDFVVSVDINTTEEVYAVDFTLNYDKNILETEKDNVTEGNFLKKDGASTYPVINVDNDKGEISFADTRFNVQTGVSGQGSLAEIKFHVKATSGASVLDLKDITLVDVNMREIPGVVETEGNVRINIPPEATNLVLIPNLPKTNESLVARYDYSDANQDPENGTEIRWYKDDVLQPDYNNLMTIPPSATSKGEKWYFTVKPKDGVSFGTLQTSASVTIQNTKPTAPIVNVAPDLPKTTDNLVCNIVRESEDVDGDQIIYTYKWYKNGVLWQGLTTNTVLSSLTKKGETWKCEVTPNDGEENGDADDDSVIVKNSAPTIDSFSPINTNLFLREGNDLQFKHTSSDADDDILSYSWKLDDVEKATTQDWIYSPVSCGEKEVTLKVSDGSEVSEQTWQVTVRLRGDVQIDGVINIFDLAAVGLAYGSKPGDDNWNENADLNPEPGINGEEEGNDVINIFDLATVGLNYGRSC